MLAAAGSPTCHCVSAKARRMASMLVCRYLQPSVRKGNFKEEKRAHCRPVARRPPSLPCAHRPPPLATCPRAAEHAAPLRPWLPSGRRGEDMCEEGGGRAHCAELWPIACTSKPSIMLSATSAVMPWPLGGTSHTWAARQVGRAAC